MDSSDGEAITESLSGHAERFADIVRRHSAAVHGYLARRSGRDTADELLGEVWLRAFRARASYDPSFSDARPWLYGIARNTLRAHWRLDRSGGAAMVDPSEDPWPEVDARLDALDRGPALRAALERLDPGDREVLLLAAWEHLTPAEISVALGAPSGTVRWRLHRARAQLRALFDDNRSSAVRHFTVRPREA